MTYFESEAFGRISLSKPSKMPGHSWSLRAGDTCPSAKLTVRDFGRAAICDGCYAKGGMYRMPNVRDAQQRRFDWLVDSMHGDDGDSAILGLVSLIERTGNAEFRVHDSGDFFTPAYVAIWTEVCKRLPDVRFWIPTREWYRDHPLMMARLRELAALPNVALRPSAAVIGDDAPEVEGLDAGTTVAFHDAPPADHWICPATATEKKACDDHGCRKCWDPTVKVAYIAHGRRMTSKATRGVALPVVKS